MESFDESIKAEFPDHNTPTDIELGLDTMHRLKVSVCDGIELSPVSKVPAQMMIFTQVALRRTVELAEAAIREMNRRNLVTSALLARGTIETSCLLWDVMFRVEEVANSGDTKRLAEIHELMSKSLLGGKAKDFRLSEEIEARNVITIIERLTKKLDAPLMAYFERLSEFAHPNYHGMMATYTVEGGDARKEFCEGRIGTRRPLILTALGTLATSISIVVRSFEMMAKDLEKLAILAEREIHESGRWPAAEPYPVQRG
jgi:hypothetical protein